MINLKLQLPRLGKIRLGEKQEAQGGKEYPAALSHFGISEFPEIVKVYGETPTSLRIVFPSNDMELICPTYYKLYGQSQGLKCRGDGERAIRLSDNFDFEEIDCPSPQYCEHGKGCKMIMNLQFILPEVKGIGVWQIDTSSFHSIRNIQSMIVLLKNSLGRVANVPLQLVLEPKEVNPTIVGKDGKEMKIKKTVYVLNLKLNASFNELQKYQQKLTEKYVLQPPNEERPYDLFPNATKEEEKNANNNKNDVSDIGKNSRELIKKAVKLGLDRSCYKRYIYDKFGIKSLKELSLDNLSDCFLLLMKCESDKSMLERFKLHLEQFSTRGKKNEQNNNIMKKELISWTIQIVKDMLGGNELDAMRLLELFNAYDDPIAFQKEMKKLVDKKDINIKQFISELEEEKRNGKKANNKNNSEIE